MPSNATGVTAIPRSGAGTYSQPAGTAAISNATIASVPYNNLIADIGNEITASLPITGVKAMAAALPMGGNRISNMADPGAAQDAVTRAYADANYAGLSSVTTYVGGTSTGTANAQVLATLVPTGFTLAAGKRIVFIPGFTNTAATTMTANALAAKNIFKMGPAGAIALSGGEIVAAQLTELIYDGTQYILSGNAQNETGPITTLASNATTDLGTIPSRNVSITGTTTITAFGATAQTAFPLYFLTFTGILTLTYNATSLILPGVASILTAAGDTAIAVYLGGGNWQVVSYTATAIPPLGTWPAGTIKGLTISRASATTFTVATGICRNEDAGIPYNMTLGSAFTKSLSAWAVGSGNGGLDTGAVAATTWYHVFPIRKDSDGSIDVLYSLSVAAPTMPTGYTAFRRVGSFLTNGSSQIVNFLQIGERFLWDVPVVDVDATNPGTAAVTRTITTPLGLVTTALVTAGVYTGTSATNTALISSLSVADTTPTVAATAALAGSSTVSAASGGAVHWDLSEAEILTNTSSQVRSRLNLSGAADHIGIITRGWVDSRGRI